MEQLHAPSGRTPDTSNKTRCLKRVVKFYERCRQRVSHPSQDNRPTDIVILASIKLKSIAGRTPSIAKILRKKFNAHAHNVGKIKRRRTKMPQYDSRATCPQIMGTDLEKKKTVGPVYGKMIRTERVLCNVMF